MLGNSGILRPLGALALALLTLSGCARLEAVTNELFASEDPASGQLQPADSGTQARHGAAQSADQALPPVPQRKPALAARPLKVPPDPDQVVGLDFDATKALLGAPSTELERPPAKVWSYDGGICMFSVFFYPSVDDKVFRVLAYEVTDGEKVPEATAKLEQSAPGAIGARNKDDPLVRRCFAELLHHQEEPNAG